VTTSGRTPREQAGEVGVVQGRATDDAQVGLRRQGDGQRLGEHLVVVDDDDAADVHGPMMGHSQ
jgi:hypothetical protein